MKRPGDEPPATARGTGIVRRLLREETFDLRRLDLPGFRDWLFRHLAGWERDPVFRRRARIRDLRRGCPDLRLLEREHRRAVRADAASEAYAELRRLERAIRGAEQAVVGLTEAARRGAAAERASLRAKRETFRIELRRLREEKGRRIRLAAERRALLRSEAKLRRLRASSGLEEEEAELARLLRERGRGGGAAGRRFEATTEGVVRSIVRPDVLRGDRASGDVRVLRGVTLGAAKVELDRVLVRTPTGADVVDVLAVVEAKRNLNDLAHGFRRRQEDLAWLTDGPGAIDLRTKAFPSGRFDREVVHAEGGETFRFGPASFRRFRRDRVTGQFPDRLYIVSRAGPVWGVSSAALSRISHRVATDERSDWGDESSLAELFEWCRSLAGPCETPDLLRRLATDAQQARRLILVCD